MKIGITTKRNLEDPNGVVSRAVRSLRRKGHEVHLCPKGCSLLGEKPLMNFERKYDLLMVFGGDGTILRTIQYMKNFKTPILSVNMGTLGFLVELEMKALKNALPKILKKEYIVDERMMLRISVMRGKEKVFTQRVLNEAVVARDAFARIISLKTTVNDRKLTTYKSDGLIIATPTGSTGYNLSLGGPILHPGLPAMILTPIAAHSFTQKPIVLPSDRRIKLLVQANHRRESIYLTLDGQIGFSLIHGDVVKIKRSTKTLRLIRMSEHGYFKTLRNKLYWGE
jgi:NAD+ kinase